MKLNDNINKELPFHVPEGYFDNLPDKILQKCQTQKGKSRKNSSIYILKPALSLAAMFIGFAVIAYLAVSLVKNTTEDSYVPNDIARANYEKKFSSEQEFIETMKNKELMDFEEEQGEYIDYLLNDDIEYGVIIEKLNQKEKDTSREE